MEECEALNRWGVEFVWELVEVPSEVCPAFVAGISKKALWQFFLVLAEHLNWTEIDRLIQALESTTPDEKSSSTVLEFKNAVRLLQTEVQPQKVFQLISKKYTAGKTFHSSSSDEPCGESIW